METSVGQGRTVRAILSAGCFISASMCLAAGYIAPAILMSAKNYSDHGETIKHMHYYTRDMSELFIIAGVLGMAAVGLAFSALLTPHSTAS